MIVKKNDIFLLLSSALIFFAEIIIYCNRYVYHCNDNPNHMCTRENTSLDVGIIYNPVMAGGINDFWLSVSGCWSIVSIINSYFERF